MESSGALLVSTGSRCVTEKFLEGVVREPILERCVGCKCVTFLDAVVKAAILDVVVKVAILDAVVKVAILDAVVKTAILDVVVKAAILDAVVKAAILESCRALLVSCVVGNIFLAELVRTAVLEVTTIGTKEVQVI